MLNTRDLYIHFVGRMTAWGLGLGAALGYIYVPLYLLLGLLIDPYPITLSGIAEVILLGTLYGFYGAPVGAIVGTIMGLLLGLLLALATQFYPLSPSSKDQYVALLIRVTAALAFFVAMVAFIIVDELYVVMSQSHPIIIITPSIIAAGAAAFSARRVAKSYIEAHREVA